MAKIEFTRRIDFNKLVSDDRQFFNYDEERLNSVMSALEESPIVVITTKSGYFIADKGLHSGITQYFRDIKNGDRKKIQEAAK